jgi:D-beta-D-heptose 7-phosphate kinase/D-beta-D-heptose 1-phosphate adenosyltransferase
VVRIDREFIAKISQDTMEAILNFIKQNLPRVQGIIISDYAKGVISRELIQRILDLAEPDTYVAVDPKIGHFDYYQDVDLITPNLKEASHAAGFEITDMPGLLKAGQVLLERLNCSSVLITRGDQGMSLFESKGTVVHIPPTCTRHVYDVTGAGDTVIATFVLARCAGASMKEAAVISNYAASIVVGEVGTATVNWKTLINEIMGKEKNETC